MLEEALGVLRALLTDAETPASFSGRFFRRPGPGRPRPGAAAPPAVGRRRRRPAAGVVARAADGWNYCWAITPEDYRRKVGVLAAACQRPAGTRGRCGARWG